MSRLDVRSQMAASVLAVPAAEGAEVAEGDVVVIVESMKMEIPLAAPAAGRVAAVLVEEGDLVAEGDILVVLET